MRGRAADRIAIASRPQAIHRALGRVFGLDLVLLHGPSVWDLRDEVIVQGPLADVIPSTTHCEMYPIGLTSIARLRAPVFGIDLHWLPHANGALGVAALVKEVHPDAKVLLGGLSASYFHEELMSNPAVDFVLRGDSTEEPCRQLLQALREGTPLEAVENLTWKRPDGDAEQTPTRADIVAAAG